jgi:hypothetical protein
MKDTYYTKEGNALKKVGSVIKTSRGWVSNPTAEDYASIGAYPRSEESFAPPKCDEGYHAVSDGYDLKGGKWVKLWKVEPIQYTYADYNRALEDYIREVRFERGYDEREPSPYYDNSEVPRWRTDAKDFREFRDKVMLYGLPILNKYKNNEEVPSLEEFKAGFPKMVWTYQEEA